MHYVIFILCIHIILYYIIFLCYFILYYIVLYYIIIYYIILCYNILYYTILYYIIFYYIILYYIYYIQLVEVHVYIDTTWWFTTHWDARPNTIHRRVCWIFKVSKSTWSTCRIVINESKNWGPFLSPVVAGLSHKNWLVVWNKVS